MRALLAYPCQNVDQPTATFQDIQQAVQVHPEKAAENLTKARWAMKERFDRGRNVATEYQVGDLVLWRDASTCSGEKGVNRKLLNKYGGPYRIAKVLCNDRYKITLKWLRVIRTLMPP